MITATDSKDFVRPSGFQWKKDEEEAGYSHRLSLSWESCSLVRQLLDTKSCEENRDDPVVLRWLFK